MNLIANISSTLPPPQGKRVLLVDDDGQDTNKIIEAIQEQHGLDKGKYDKIAYFFWDGNAKKTAQKLFDFHKGNIQYKIEPESDQTVRTPERLLEQGHGDCKHYSGFTCGVVDALNRMGYPISCSYRFVSEDPGREVHHVFAVITDGRNTYWCDPVLDWFDQRVTFYNQKNWAMAGIGAISRLSGVGAFNFKAYFPTQEHVRSFLHRHGVHPHEFNNEGHMYEGLQRLIHKHHYQPHQVHAMHQARMSGFDRLNDMPMVANIGRKKKNNIFRQVAHGMQVNAKNFTKGVKIAAEQGKELALKVGTAPARHAFLSLVAVNARSLATNLARWQGHPEWNKIMDKWKHLGGDVNVLRRTITNGAKQKRLGALGRRHPLYIVFVQPAFGGHAICGIGILGADDAAVAAWTALASAVLAALSQFIHKPGAEGAASRAAEVKAIKDGAASILANTYNAAKNADDPEGAASTAALEQMTKAGGDNAAVMTVTPGVNADGSPTVTVHDMSHPATKEALQDAGQNDGTDGGTTSAPPIVNAASVTDGGKPNMFKEFADSVKKGWDDYHVPVLIGTGLIIAVTQVPKLMKKRRR
jgi:hypothetical protein